MSLRTMEDQGGQMGGESGSAWPGPNLPAVAATYSLGFSSHVCPDTIEAPPRLQANDDRLSQEQHWFSSLKSNKRTGMI